MKSEPKCDARHSHEERLAIEGKMPPLPSMLELANLFKLFGDPTRVRILYALSRAELCVCDLAALLGMTQSAVSHQLRFLRDGRVVKSRRDGRQVLYTMHDHHVLSIFKQGLIHIKEPHEGNS